MREGYTGLPRSPVVLMSVGGSAASQTISCRRFEAEVPRREARRWRSRVM
jgi:hypothetical protein